MSFKLAIIFIDIFLIFLIISFKINFDLFYCTLIHVDVHKLKKIDKDKTHNTLLRKYF